MTPLRYTLSATCFLLLVSCGGTPIQKPLPEDGNTKLLDEIRANPGPGQIARVWDLCGKIHDARPWLTLGYLYHQEGNAGLSLACYGFALHYDPGNRTVRRWFIQNGKEPYSGQITFRWAQAPDVDGYYFYFRLGEGLPLVRLNGKYARDPEITVNGLEADKTYECGISTVQDWGENDLREGALSPLDRRKAYPGVARADTRIQARWKGGGGIKIKWKRSQELWVRSYHVSIVMPGSPKPTRLTKGAPVTDTHYEVEDLPLGARYKVIVSQVGAQNEEEVYAETEVEIPLK